MFYAAYVVLSGLGKVDIGPTGFKPTVNVVGLTFESTSPPLSLSSFLIPRKNPWFPLPFSENSKPWMDVEGDFDLSCPGCRLFNNIMLYFSCKTVCCSF
jgi:hypothetical protein